MAISNSITGFYFDPKQWLGEATVLAMDWDCRAYHLQFMCIAWQKDERYKIPNDDKYLRKLIGNPDEKDWLERIKPQVFSAWKLENEHWIQKGLKKQFEKPTIISKTRKNKNNIEKEAPAGFLLENILNISDRRTILHEKISEKEQQTIWSFGVKLLMHEGCNEKVARSFLGKQISLYGDKNVASALGEMSIKKIEPAQAQSYLSGILRKQGEENKEKKGRGKVAL